MQSGSIPFPVHSYRFSFLDRSTKILIDGVKKMTIHEIFKMGMQILSVFLDGSMHAAVSGLEHLLTETAQTRDLQMLMLIG